MKILLSGYNLDSDTLDEARKKLKEALNYINDIALRDEIEAFLDKDHFTPETLSAAYARISRNPKPVPELRKSSRSEVAKSRKSNKTIIFGLGHSSVAEHAVFNFDILGVSRRVVEEIQHFRLASFTEKSQRYIRLEDDFVIPEEIKNSAYNEEFVEMIRVQNEAYGRYYSVLKPYMFEKHKELAKEEKNHRLLEGWAKEDARYIVSLATESQMGMTVNARTLERMIARLAAGSLSEAKKVAEKLYEVTGHLAPSIIKYTEPSNYDLSAPLEFMEEARKYSPEKKEKARNDDEVKLIWAREDGDERILEALLIQFAGYEFGAANNIAFRLSKGAKKELFKKIFRHLESFNGVPRAFERAEAEFELIVSASCFGQLKRHRMSTQLTGPYLPELGNTIPQSIKDTGLENDFLRIIDKTNSLYSKMRGKVGIAAEYVLTNSHRRRVFFKANLRELYHFSRLRQDEHAQWDIRAIADEITKKISKEWPLSTALLGGKHQFEKLKDSLFVEEK